ncbi:helix-turn-helix transcriptional regulator [Streptomyces sp. NPDC092307]|uniref:helix-turn-helix transcriptional regulator n=1 Tax=Streptomyces sp. NPDC092307 TaxID=3366013 RepID=UPI0037F898B1
MTPSFKRQPEVHSSGQPPAPDSDAAVYWRNRATELFDRLPLRMAFCLSDGTILRANSAFASEWGVLAGTLRGRGLLTLLRVEFGDELDSVTEAIRQRRRARYAVAVRWTTEKGAERCGDGTVDLVGNPHSGEPDLLVIIHMREEPPGPVTAGPPTHPYAGGIEGRIIALTAGGSTSAQTASVLGITADGVNYHLKRLSRLWGVSGKPALVARAYAEGILAPGTWPPSPATL